MAANESELHQQCMQRFIDLANTMKNEGAEPRVVSAALMTASGVYATYTVTGNSGGLNESGVNKVTDAYRQVLQNIQQARRAEQQQQ